MGKNIAIFVMSPFLNDAKVKEYTDGHGFKAECIHTNETALKYIEWKLSQNGEKIDKAYAFVSEDVKANHLEKFKALFPQNDYSIRDVQLFNNGDLDGSFTAVCMMFDVLREELQENLVGATFHIDMTGGPRHSSMLMLALLNMLTYYGSEIGLVIYTNFQRHLVEDAKDIIEMFSLMSGTQEFISYGSVDQIKRYFDSGKEKTIYMESLLDAMEGVSEALKICASYPDMQVELQKLANVINLYKQYLSKAKMKGLGKQELFFSKLLPSIEREYSEVLPRDGKDCDALKIIKWCLERGFLQQGITLYTEWLPVYLIDNNIIKINDAAICADCMKQKNDWNTWQNHFVRIYKLEKSKSENSVVPDEINNEGEFYNYLHSVLCSNNPIVLENLLQVARGNSEIFTRFLESLIDLDKKVNAENFVRSIYLMNDSNLIKKLLSMSTPGNCDFSHFLTTRINKVGIPSMVVLTALKTTQRSFIKETFFPALVNVREKKADKQDKIAERIETFKLMHESKAISINIREKDFYEFLRNYLNCVQQWRHKFNHAAGKAEGRTGNDEIKEAILHSLEKLNR